MSESLKTLIGEVVQRLQQVQDNSDLLLGEAKEIILECINDLDGIYHGADWIARIEPILDKEVGRIS